MSKVINSKSVAARRAKAISLIGQGLVHSQSDLVKLLAKEGFRVTQATASRDLEEIGAVRGRSTDGRSFYELRNRGQSQQSQLMPIPTNLILSVESSANIAVVRTPPGGAQLVASSLDSAGMDSIIGTIAGDDTVLVISKKATGGGELAKQLLALSKIKKSSIDRRS
jgi:transcriptional regulator of arginine metabolism